MAKDKLEILHAALSFAYEHPFAHEEWYVGAGRKEEIDLRFGGTNMCFSEEAACCDDAQNVVAYLGYLDFRVERPGKEGDKWVYMYTRKETGEKDT